MEKYKLIIGKNNSTLCFLSNTSVIEKVDCSNFAIHYEDKQSFIRLTLSKTAYDLLGDILAISFDIVKNFNIIKFFIPIKYIKLVVSKNKKL